MSDYSGDATLEDWLSKEVFNSPVPKEVVDKFKGYRTGIENDVGAWISQSYDEWHIGWRSWGRGYNTVDEEFEVIVQSCIAQVTKYKLSQVDMARYTGKATLEDWLSIEVFKCPIPKDVVHRFERYRTRVESDVQAWIDQCDTQRQGWNLWGRGRDNLDDSFYGLVQVCTPYVEAYAEFHGLARHDCTMSLYNELVHSARYTRSSIRDNACNGRYIGAGIRL
jgi:hypothetical protein